MSTISLFDTAGGTPARTGKRAPKTTAPAPQFTPADPALDAYRLHSMPQAAPKPSADPHGVEALPTVSTDARLKANQTVRDILARGVTPADHAALRAWSGEGGLGEHSASTSAFYTPGELVQVAYDLSQALGSTRRILEFSCGGGAFLARAPKFSDVVGVELDETSAAVAQALHPHVTVWNASFETYTTQSEDAPFDLVIGNPPFGTRGAQARLHRPDLRQAHWYFVLEGLRRVTPGGLMTVVVPESMLRVDSDRPHREALIDLAHPLMLSAVPEGAFRAAGAGVTTVLLVLRRHDAGVTEALNALTHEEQAQLREQRLTHSGYLRQIVNGEGVFYRSGTEWKLQYAGEPLGTPRHQAKIGDGRFGDPVYPGGLRVDLETLTKQASARVNDILTLPGALAAIQTLLGTDVEARARQARPQAHPITDGETSACGTYRFQGGRWQYGSHLSNPTVLSALTVAQAITAARSGQQHAARDTALRLHDTHLSTHGAYDLTLLRRAAKSAPALHALVEANGDVPALLTELTDREPPITPGTIGEVAQQLEAYGLLTITSLARYAQVTDGDAAAHLLAQYAFTGHTWEAASTYYRGRAHEKARLAETLAADHTGTERQALLQQAQTCRERALWVDITDMTLEARDPLIPEHVLADWVNANLGTCVAVKRNSWDADGAPVNLIQATRGEHGVTLRLRNALDDELALKERQAISPGRVRELEAYLNFRTPVEPVVNQDVKTPEQITAERHAHQARAVQFERQLAAHFRTWLLGSEHVGTVELTLNEHRYGLLTATPDLRPLTLPRYQGPLAHPFQAGHVRAAARMDGVILDFGVGLGKALAHGMRVCTPRGFVPIEELKIGDQVTGANGKPTIITGVFPQGIRPTYRVHFSDDSSVICDEDHLWSVRPPSKGDGTISFRVLTLREILAEGLYRKGDRGHKKHFIPMTQPVEFAEQPSLPLDPYVLGALLGDGCLTTYSRKTRGALPNMALGFSSADEEIILRLRATLPVGIHVRKKPERPNAKYDYSLCVAPGRANPVKGALRALGLAGRTSKTKFIPDCYKYSSIQERIELMHGLMDTDGHVRADNNVEFCTTSLQLAEDVQFIVQSLGGTAPIREKRIDGVVRAYRQSIALPVGINPFWLKRKATAYRPRTKYPPSRAITRVEPLGSQPATCISVDADDHLFLTEQFIVTHNTLTALMLAELLLQSGRARLPAVVVPLSRLGDWVMNAATALPGLRVSVIGGEPVRAPDGSIALDEDGEPRVLTDTGDRRRAKIAALLTSPPDLVIMTYEAFEMIPMLEETRKRFVREDETLMSALATTTTFDERHRKMGGHRALAAAEKFTQRHLGRVKVATSTDVPFEALGIDAVLWDEAHALKNTYAAPAVYGDSSPKFLGGGGESNRALDGNHKARFVRERGGCTVALSATWFTNSPLEIWNMLSLVTDALPAYGITNVQAFTARFCVIEPRLITLPEGDVEFRSCVVGFRNLDELRAVIGQHVIRETEDTCQMHDRVGMPLPPLATVEHLFDLHPVVQDEYDAEQATISEAESEGEKHLFSIFSRLSKLTLHPPLMNVQAPNARFAACVQACLTAREQGGRNVVFMYTGGEGGMTYTALRDQLIAAGYPAGEIEIITASTHQGGERLTVERRFRRGVLTCVIGSSVIEQGGNYQGATDLHHLDYPHHHMAFVQRIGRGRRQGTWVKEIRNHVYFARGSFDVIRYQNMMGKKGWAQQVFDPTLTSCENTDVGFDGEELAVMLSRDPDATRHAIRAKREARQAESHAASLLADLTVIREYLEALSLLEKRDRTARSREHGPSTQDVAGINRLVTALRGLHGQVQALRAAANPMAALTRLTQPIVWVEGLPIHAGLTFEHQGNPVTVRDLRGADTGVRVTDVGGNVDVIAPVDLARARHVQPTRAEGAYGAEGLTRLRAELRERILSADVAPQVPAQPAAPIQLAPVPEIQPAPMVAAADPVGETTPTPCPAPAVRTAQRPPLRLRYGLTVTEQLPTRPAQVYAIQGDTLTPGAVDGCPLVIVEYRAERDVRMVTLVLPDHTRAEQTRTLLRRQDPRVRARMDQLLLAAI
ncbi:LAGLIDADG family homing endonuclease [Deinococcus indicus]|nr:LAGLIDADG family homing endonuclease [Deinococcus indicus]